MQSSIVSGLLASNTNINIFNFLKYIGANDLNYSLPAVSKIFSYNVILSFYNIIF